MSDLTQLRADLDAVCVRVNEIQELLLPGYFPDSLLTREPSPGMEAFGAVPSLAGFADPDPAETRCGCGEAVRLRETLARAMDALQMTQEQPVIRIVRALMVLRGALK